MNVPGGGVIRCLLWSGVMGLKKASVDSSSSDFGVFYRRGSKTGAHRLERCAFGATLPLLVGFFFFFSFSLCEKTILARSQEFVPKGI